MHPNFYSVQKFQWILIIVAAGLVFGLYKFGRTVPDKKTAASQAQIPATGAEQQIPAADFDTLLTNAKKNLSPAKLMQIAQLEHNVVRGDVKDQQIATYRRLAGVWDSLNHLPIAAHYLGEAAKLENSEKSLTFAANLFLGHLQHTDNGSVRKWEANEANELLQKAVALNGDNDSLKVALASSYIEGGDVMQGVQQLLAVTAAHPDNADANLMLGRLSVTSGQFDKAVERLNKVLVQQPDNTEALYFLAEAYRGKGETDKAIQLFEKCKQLINNPEFSKQIDDYIKTLK